MKSPNSMFIANSTSRLPPKVRVALALLHQAHDTASRLARDKWDFAVEIQAMKEVGLNHNDLRFLICHGLVVHLSERTRPGAKRRTFRRPRSLRLHTESCFVLSESGISVAREIIAHESHAPYECHRSDCILQVSPLPVWDSDRRELRVGNVLVKRFRQPAKNQETILATFQEDGWPPHIDNPLSGKDDTDAQTRLHDAVKKLNHQVNCVLHFLCDGNGCGVVWELME